MGVMRWRSGLAGWTGMALLLGAATLRAGGPRVPPLATPEARISLVPLGYKPVTAAIVQRQGYSLNSLNFVDDEHVLVTFGVRKLMLRLPDDPEDDQDRLIKAVVLHLPEGKVVRETEWRTHDRQQYLWPMRDGHFLLRLRNNLYRVTPLQGREGFERETLLESRRTVEVLEFSPEKNMLLVETAPERRVGDDPTVPLAEPKIEASFYNVVEGPRASLKLRAVAAEDRPFLTAFTSKGLLNSVREDREHWGFDFQPFGGKKIELAGFMSTCQPHAEFVSNATFIATGCRGGDDRRLLAGFDLAAEASWAFTVDDPPVWPAIAEAPGSDRFAMRVTQLTTGGADPEHVGPDEVKGQQIRVYNFHGGVEMLRVPIGPVQRPAQNFALSQDGRRLAVLHDGNLEVYALPPESEADRKDLARVKAAAAKIEFEAERQVEVKPEKSR